MLSPRRFHTDPTRSHRWSVWMLVVALLAVGPLSGWSTLIRHFGAGPAGGPCPHHSSGPHVCPHHAAMQASHAHHSENHHDEDAPAMPEGTTFCPTHAKTAHHDGEHAHQHASSDNDNRPQVRCTCDHDNDAAPEAVRILDKFVLTGAEQLRRPLYTYALRAAPSSLQPTVWAHDIFRPPRA